MNFTPVDFDPFEELEIIIPTSESQRELISSVRFGNDAANCAYNESVSIKLKGVFNYEAIVDATNAVVARHGSLRATFIDEGLKMRIASNLIVDVPLIDISAVPVADQNAHLNEIISEDVSTPFDLPNGPLFEVKIVRLNKQLHYVIITAHHIICDGWSTGIVMQDISRFYNKFAFGIETDITPAIQFDQYVNSELEFENGPEYEATEAFWLALYKDYKDVFEIPIDKPRPAIRSYNAKRIDKFIPTIVSANLKKLGAKNGCSFVNTLIAAFEVYLYKLTQQSEIIVGLPAAGQSVTDNYSLVGHCVNLLPLKTSVDGSKQFIDYLRNRKTSLFDALENQRFTFGTLIKKLKVPRDPSRIPLVPVAFNVDLGMTDGVRFEGLEIEVVSNPRTFENFEIFLNLSGHDQDLTMECTFNTDLFDEDIMLNRVEEFLQFLTSISESFDQVIDDIKILPNAEKLLLEKWNATADAQTLEGNLQSLFAKQVAKTPKAIALKYKEQTFTYKQLDEFSNRIANHLIDNKLKTGDLVGICIDRSSEMLMTMLGILKAGGAYLPIDPEFPADRINYMIKNSELNFIITQENIDDQLHFNCNNKLFIDNWEAKLSKKITPPLTSFDSGLLAYVLYTSGSTGLPKGVMIYNSALTNLLQSFLKITNFKATDALLALTTISFDIAELELYLPLITGGTVVIASKDAAADPRSIATLIEQEQITFMQATPITWRMLIESGWIGNKNLNVLCGGEALPVELATSLIGLSKNIWNVYGPTETTIWSSVYFLNDKNKNQLENNSFVNIGQPIANTTFYILDKHLNRLPIGVEGDIYIGGAGLAKGYLNSADLTQERFIASSFEDSQSAFIYRTGDLGKFNKDGQIEYKGRSDFQVKVRGFRIELGEIETSISQIEEVSAVAVVAKPDKNNEHQLLAYVTQNVNDNQTNAEKESHVNNWKEKWDLIYDAGIKSIANEDIKNRKLDTEIVKQISGHPEIEIEVREWLVQTIERIKQLKPKRVFEIGCGAGQILIEIAPDCEYYYATDYSKTALNELQSIIDQNLPILKEKVLLDFRFADDFKDIAPESFDTIIINSVIQYFPDINYLERVIEGCFKILKPGGCLFIGDVQSHSLLVMYHTREQLNRIDGKQNLEQLRKLIEKRIKGELELTVDTEFFESLKQQNNQLAFTQYMYRKGRVNNETTKYHYDVYLYKQPELKSIEKQIWYNWYSKFKTIEKLIQYLSTTPDEILLISDVPNDRLLKDKIAFDLVQKSENTVLCGTINEQLVNLPDAYDPQTFWDLADKYGYVAEIYWTDRNGTPSFDLAFIKKEVYDSGAKINPQYFSKPFDYTKRQQAANQPYKADLNAVLISKIKQHLERNLPHYMLPAAYKVLTQMPLTTNGKIDRKALPDFQVKIKQNESAIVNAQTETEIAISAIWKKLLNLEKVSINDNFFELGGHSLIAVRLMIEIEHIKNVRLPLAILFTNPTIYQLASVIDSETSNELWKSIVPIRPTGSKKPFFFAHGISGNVFKYHALGRYLSDYIPSYGLQAFGLNGIDKPFSKLEDMVNYHVTEILKMQPEGPYFLGGGSFGGTLAYEIACKLESMGHEIGFVALFDVDAATKTEVLEGMEKKLVDIKLKSQRVVSRLKLLANQSMDENLVYLKNKINNKNPNAEERKLQIDKWLDKDLIADKYGTNSADYFNNIEESCYKSLNNYQIQSGKFQVVLFRAKNGFYSNIEYEEDLGWGYFVEGEIAIDYVPGNHNSIFDSPQVSELAKALMKHIDNYYIKNPNK